MLPNLLSRILTQMTRSAYLVTAIIMTLMVTIFIVIPLVMRVYGIIVQLSGM